MTQKNSKKQAVLTLAFLLTVVPIVTPTFAVNAVEHRDNKLHTEKNTLAAEIEPQIAQSSNNCYQVIAKRGVYIREKPTVYSTALGIVAYGRNVEVAGEITNNWVPISAPLQGYVYADWISRCQAASPPPNNCRLVISTTGIPARQEPSNDSKLLGYISSGRRVIITGRGANGWVPISVPFKGYVPSDRLAYCRNLPS